MEKALLTLDKSHKRTHTFFNGGATCSSSSQRMELHMITINGNVYGNIIINGNGEVEEIRQVSREEEQEAHDRPQDFGEGSYSLSTAEASSFIERITYVSTANVLMVQIAGNIYMFFGVPDEVAHEFYEADSLGAYFNRHLKGRYACPR